MDARPKGIGDRVTPLAISIAATLDQLCRVAGVSPAESSPEAGAAVCDALRRAGVFPVPGSESCPLSCPLNRWLRGELGLPEYVSVHESPRVIITTGAVRVHRWEGGVLRCESVGLPVAVKAALVLLARPAGRAMREASGREAA